jgi:hypothetical protein
MSQSLTHKRKLRDAKFEKLYGGDWRVKLKDKLGENWEQIIENRKLTKVERKLLSVVRLPRTEVPQANRLMHKRDFLKRLEQRLQDPEITDNSFSVLAKIYSELRNWTGVLARPAYTGGPASRVKELPPEPSVTTLDKEVLRIEAELEEAKNGAR